VYGIMQHVRGAVACAGITMLFGGSLQAASINGVWASDQEACNKIFVFKGNKVSFHGSADLHGSGFIIEGKRIRGRTANCKITRMKTEKSIVTMIASCATDIMFSSVQFALKIDSEDKVTRLFPGMEGMEVPYYRCLRTQPKTR
jgi:hypothetical protein